MKRTIAALALFLVALSAFADRFVYRYEPGDKFRVISTVYEKIYINRRFSHAVTILNKIAFSVDDVRDDGSAYLKGQFQTTTQPEKGAGYVIDTTYESEYWLGRFGVYTIAPEYYMPVVRNVPTFPDRELAPGDTWTAPGEERQDFRLDFGIPEPYVIPFEAQYKYLGDKEWKGTEYPAFSVKYTVFYRPGRPSAYKETYPTQIVGVSEQVVYWDTAIGRPMAYEETFRFVFDLANGEVVEYAGKADAYFVEAETMDRGALKDDIKDDVAKLDNVTVTEDERGVTISLEDIKFEPESAVLKPSETAKLDVIAEILKKYPGRDILVSGHTALAGTAEGRMALSIKRAQAVADYLIKKGVRLPEQMFVMGFGATKPIADNSTAAGMARNRRVEITLMEN